MNKHTNEDHFREAGTCMSWGLHQLQRPLCFTDWFGMAGGSFWITQSSSENWIKQVSCDGVIIAMAPALFSASWYPHSLVVSSTLTLSLARWPALTNGTSKCNASKDLKRACALGLACLLFLESCQHVNMPGWDCWTMKFNAQSHHCPGPWCETKQSPYVWWKLSGTSWHPADQPNNHKSMS